jgi:hypothetical protein
MDTMCPFETSGNFPTTQCNSDRTIHSHQGNNLKYNYSKPSLIRSDWGGVKSSGLRENPSPGKNLLSWAQSIELVPVSRDRIQSS